MRYLTAGESHGKQLTAIIEGLPSNLPLSIEKINEELKRRQKGYGRSNRMKIENDEVRILSGLHLGKTTGAPLTLVINNKDYRELENNKEILFPRPGHADLNGVLKYKLKDIRIVLERASARETAIRVAVGAVAKQLLVLCKIAIASHVIQIGDVKAKSPSSFTLDELQRIAEASIVRCVDKDAELKMLSVIDKARKKKDTLGGIIEILATGLPIGLGSYVHWDKKLDACIAKALISIQAFKGVEFGLGFSLASKHGSSIHDEIFWCKEKGYFRKTNNMGGFEGGMTTGQPLIIRAVVKPLATLYKPLLSINIKNKESGFATIERSDVCAVVSACVVAENVVAWEIAKALMAKFPCDSFDYLLKYLAEYRKELVEN